MSCPAMDSAINENEPSESSSKKNSSRSTKPEPLPPLPSNSRLSFLNDLDRIQITHGVEMYNYSSTDAGAIGLAARTPYDILKENTFDIIDGRTQERLYVGTEGYENDLQSLCYGNSRHFKITINNLSHNLVLMYKRNLCENKVRGYYGEGTEVIPFGSVIKLCHPITPKYAVLDLRGRTRLKVIGPTFGKVGCLCCCLAGNVDFNLFRPGGGEGKNDRIGKIFKKWGGCYKEICTTSDSFFLSFPKNLHPFEKGLLIGAVLLIDYMYFQVQGTGCCCSRETPA